MPGVLRMARLNGLLGAHVNGDGNDGQDADVPGTGQTGSESGQDPDPGRPKLA